MNHISWEFFSHHFVTRKKKLFLMKSRMSVKKAENKTLSWCKTRWEDKFDKKTQEARRRTGAILMAVRRTRSDSHTNEKNKIQFLIVRIQKAITKCSLTFLPAWLLCKFISLRASASISRTSRNFLANLIPKSISTLHPPHFQDF